MNTSRYCLKVLMKTTKVSFANLHHSYGHYFNESLLSNKDSGTVYLVLSLFNEVVAYNTLPISVSMSFEQIYIIISVFTHTTIVIYCGSLWDCFHYVVPPPPPPHVGHLCLTCKPRGGGGKSLKCWDICVGSMTNSILKYFSSKKRTHPKGIS